jgi:hypothetical protein
MGVDQESKIPGYSLVLRIVVDVETSIRMSFQNVREVAQLKM